jgi:hypothetical protein
VYGEKKTVSPSDALQLFHTTPTERIERLSGQVADQSTKETFRTILHRYDTFLEQTNAAEAELIKEFERVEFRQEAVVASRDFGDLVFKALQQVGHNNSFYRMIVV